MHKNQTKQLFTKFVIEIFNLKRTKIALKTALAFKYT